MYLLENQTVNTDGSQTTIEGSGGTLLIQADGTFDGATVTIQGRMHGFTWQDLEDNNGEVVSLTENEIVVAGWCKAGFQIRGSLTGAGGSTDVSVGIL